MVRFRMPAFTVKEFSQLRKEQKSLERVCFSLKRKNERLAFQKRQIELMEIIRLKDEKIKDLEASLENKSDCRMFQPRQKKDVTLLDEPTRNIRKRGADCAKTVGRGEASPNESDTHRVFSDNGNRLRDAWNPTHQDSGPPPKIHKDSRSVLQMVGSGNVGDKGDTFLGVADDQQIQPPPVDESKPTTNIQVRLGNGERLVLKLNNHHTVKNLHQFICQVRPDLANRKFDLMTNFPKKQLTNEFCTLEEANLLNSIIIQYFK